MKAWILNNYGKFGVSVSREHDDYLVMSFPKDFSNFSDVVRSVDEQFESVCDLSYDEDGLPEVKFWKKSTGKPEKSAMAMMMYIAVIATLAVAISLLWLQDASGSGEANPW